MSCRRDICILIKSFVRTFSNLGEFNKLSLQRFMKNITQNQTDQFVRTAFFFYKISAPLTGLAIVFVIYE